MKKLLTTGLCLSLLSVNLICFASETNQVKVNFTNVPLKSPLQNKYSAYRINYINEGQNPVMVNDVKCYNRVVYANVFNEYKTSKKTIICAILALPTLGLSNLFAAPDIMKQNTGVLEAENEAKRFNAFDLANTNNDSGNMKTNNETLLSGQSIQFNVLVPLNETPDMTGSFEDTTTHKYIRVQNDK